MPSHPDRVRLNYACRDCEGTGRVEDCEYSGPCSNCNGSGVRLTPDPPRPEGRQLSPAEQAAVDESLKRLARNLAFVSEVNREYPDAKTGSVVRVKRLKGLS